MSSITRRERDKHAIGTKVRMDQPMKIGGKVLSGVNWGFDLFVELLEESR